MADQQPSEPIEIVIGATYGADLVFTDLPADLGSLATAISFELRADPSDPAPFFAATMASGAISVTGPAVASLLLAASDTATLPPGRCLRETWLTLTTGEKYRTDFSICNITGRN